MAAAVASCVPVHCHKAKLQPSAITQDCSVMRALANDHAQYPAYEQAQFHRNLSWLLWLPCNYFCDIAGRRRRDAIVMDAPIWYHTPKLILWCIFEALDLFLVIWVTRKPSR